MKEKIVKTCMECERNMKKTYFQNCRNIKPSKDEKINRNKNIVI